MTRIKLPGTTKIVTLLMKMERYFHFISNRDTAKMKTTTRWISLDMTMMISKMSKGKSKKMRSCK